MEKCCGSECATKYCPYCGKQVLFSPLEDLLRHCRRSAQLNRNAAQKYSRPGEPDSKFVIQHKKRAAIWQDRTDALQKLMRASNDAREQRTPAGYGTDEAGRMRDS